MAKEKKPVHKFQIQKPVCDTFRASYRLVRRYGFVRLDVPHINSKLSRRCKPNRNAYVWQAFRQFIPHGCSFRKELYSIDSRRWQLISSGTVKNYLLHFYCLSHTVLSQDKSSPLIYPTKRSTTTSCFIAGL